MNQGFPEEPGGAMCCLFCLPFGHSWLHHLRAVAASIHPGRAGQGGALSMSPEASQGHQESKRGNVVSSARRLTQA